MDTKQERKSVVAGQRARRMTCKSLGGGLIVCVHTADAPADDEWNQILGLFRAVPDLQKGRVLVSTLGGAPDARQRARLNAVVGDAKPRIAVLTPSALARAAGTAISWFIPTLRMFELDALQPALDHLDVSRVDREALTRGLDEAKKELGL
jgi:hypothetical protein